jgi:hypothetical protein
MIPVSDALRLLAEGESPSTWPRWAYDEQLGLEGGTLAERDAMYIDLSSWSPEFPGPLILIQASHLGMSLYPEELTGNAESQDSWQLVPRSKRYRLGAWCRHKSAIWTRRDTRRHFRPARIAQDTDPSGASRHRATLVPQRRKTPLSGRPPTCLTS